MKCTNLNKQRSIMTLFCCVALQKIINQFLFREQVSLSLSLTLTHTHTAVLQSYTWGCCSASHRRKDMNSIDNVRWLTKQTRVVCFARLKSCIDQTCQWRNRNRRAEWDNAHYYKQITFSVSNYCIITQGWLDFNVWLKTLSPPLFLKTVMNSWVF